MEKIQYQGSLIDRRLKVLSRDGGFATAYLLSKEGLALGGDVSDYDQTKMMEITKLVLEILEKTEAKLGFSQTDEISLVDNNKTRLVFRPFKVGKKNPHILILVIATMINQPYRMLTNKAMVSLKKIWEEMYS